MVPSIMALLTNQDQRKIALSRFCVFLSLILLFLLSGCEINRLRSAEDLYNKGSYAGAIGELDELIRVGKNGAIVTRAELVRGNCYLELGKIATERGNLPLAIRFMKLSNSEASDVELGNIYKKLGEIENQKGNKALAKEYWDSVIREIPNSPLVPEMLLRRIGFYLEEYQDRNSSWVDYRFLYDNFPNNPYEIQARSYVSQFIQSKIDYAIRLKNQEYFTEALQELFELSKYPVVKPVEINRLISEVYQTQAEKYIDDQDYKEADRLFKIAIQYYPEKKKEIDSRLESIAMLFVQKGNNLQETREFDAALIQYRMAFDIIPDYLPASKAIEKVEKIRSDIKRATAMFAEGERLEASQKYSEALNAYNQAIALDSKAEYRAKAIQMQNLIDATRNPSAFAHKILNEFRGGLLIKRVAAKKAELLRRHKASDIRDSGWKLLLSSGQYRYEARYDLLTPNETFLYIWQINLRDRSVIPLNKLSEALME